MGQRIALPAHAADLLVEMSVAIGHNVEPGGLLGAQINRDRVLVLLAVAQIHHCFEEVLRAGPRCVPARPRQGSDDRSRQGHVG
jgi:hypothetical protein